MPRHQQQQQQESKKNRKAKLALPKLDDSEEGKAKRQILFDVLYMLASFHGDRDRFHAIVEGLLVISSASVKLTFIEKLSENFNRKEHLFMRLLDVGFEIILSQPDAFLTPAKVMAAYTTDMDLGRPPDKADIARITVHERLADLDLQDLMGFCRKLFEYQQWERFGILARILDEMFETEVFKHACSASEQEAASRELVLRLAAINFQNVVRSERKVEFDTATNTSMTDLSAERFLVSAQLQTAAIALLDSLADCIETESLVSQYPSLFVDTTRLLWEFLEPMTHSINSVADAPQCASLSMDSMLLILLRSLHAVLTELPSEDSLLLVDVGGKLALIMECMDCLQEAVEVLEDIEAVISIARCHFGEAADGVTSVTCNVNFHTKLPVASPAAGPVLESVTDGAGAADKLQVTRRNLACAAVSGYRRLARCRMKMWLKDREALQKKKVSEHLRLTNKDLRTTPIRTHVDEDKIALYCGENLTLRAMTLTVHASEGSNLPKAAKQRLLETAVSLLGRVYKDEGRMLTDILRNTHPKGHAPGVCPPPMFVRRSPTSVTMKAVHMRNALGETVVPHSYQLYCRKLGSDKMAIVTISDMAYPGSGHQVRTGRGDGCVELTVSGLSPNQKYAFAVCAFGRDGKTLGRGIGETSRPVVTCLPLPLLLCWGQIVNIAHEAHCEDIADQSYNLLKKHFVTWLAPDERLRRTAFESQVSDPYSEATFKLNDDDLETTAPSILRAFIESIYASIDRRFSKTHAIVHADIEGICDTLGAQNMRLTCCRELLIALELAKRIEDERLMLLSSFKCYELLVPFLLLDDVADPTKLQMNSPVPTPMPYIIQILTTCHATFIKCSAVLGNDRLHGVTDHYAYLAFHLIRRLTARKVPADIARAVKVAEDALALIHAIAGTSSDTRILSSATLEAEWLGPEHRAAKRRISKKRGKGRAIITDCAYHALLSTTTDFGKGYDLHRTRRLEAMCEYFDVEIGRAALAALPPGQPSSSRKTLDQASTSLREIYSLLTLSGPDVTIENITKFRKNPRYIEIMGLAAAWCLAAGHFIDTAIRICLDAEDWTEKRNYCVFRFEDLAENEEDETGGGGKQEDAWWSKRKKRAMFGDKSAGLLITKSEDRKRGRKAKRFDASEQLVEEA
ncbi:hypothetical protein HKX48_004727 [Thoreauomyces humboldtii]|nr:hypothetical protein HKX48_004727 [Thoreauomyces humboldtii]